MKTTISFLFILILSIGVFGQKDAELFTKKKGKIMVLKHGLKWRLIGNYKIGETKVLVGFDSERIVRKGDAIEFWSKEILEPETKEFLQGWLINPKRLLPPDNKSAESFSYRLTLRRGDCRTMKYSLIQMIDYWKGGKKDSKDLEAGYESYELNSVSEAVLNKTCTFKKMATPPSRSIFN